MRNNGNRRWVLPVLIGTAIAATTVGLTIVLANMEQPSARTTAAIPPPLTVGYVRNPSGVTIKYDRFDDHTNITAETEAFDVWTIVPGNVDRCPSGLPKDVCLSVFRSDEQVRGECIFVLSDDRRINCEAVDAGWQWACFTVKTTDLIAIAEDTHAAARIGGKEIGIDRIMRERIRNFLSVLNP